MFIIKLEGCDGTEVLVNIENVSEISDVSKENRSDGGNSKIIFANGGCRVIKETLKQLRLYIPKCGY